MTTPEQPAEQPTDAPAPALWAQRCGPHQYIGHNERGAQVRVGDDDEAGAFTPGELLRLALAACTARSTEHLLTKQLGEDHAAVLGISAERDDDENRYASMLVELLVDLGELDDDARASLLEHLQSAAERQCTVGRTLSHGVAHELRVTSEPIEG